MELRKIKPKINKKGSIEDLFLLIVTLLGFAIFIIILAYVIPQVTDGMLQTELNNSASVRAVFAESDNIVDKFDAVYLIIFAGLVISIFITSFLINSHPIFIPIFIILFGFAIIIGVIANNVYDEFAANTDMATTAASQVYITTIMDHFIEILVGVGVISMIILFAKPLQRSEI